MSDSGDVVVGPKSSLGANVLYMRGVEIRDTLPERVFVQPSYRVRDGAIEANILTHKNGKMSLSVEDGAVVSPGQAAVLYDAEGVVVAAGLLTRG